MPVRISGTTPKMISATRFCAVAFEKVARMRFTCKARTKTTTPVATVHQ